VAHWLNMGSAFKVAHIPVLKGELIESLQIAKGHIVVDLTLGAGGHALAVAEVIGESGKLFAFDRDPVAIVLAKERLKDRSNITYFEGKFSEVREQLEKYQVLGRIDAMYADIGVSSMQLDTPSRGFSFQQDGPLDMRMNPLDPISAAQVVNDFSEEELARIFRDFGDEPRARAIATMIVRRRAEKPFLKTLDLAEAIKSRIHYKTKSRKHPATRTFQAIRIYVNSEFDELKSLMASFFTTLKPQGRIGIITFHSLEDRIVKSSFKKLATIDIPRGVPIRDEYSAPGKIIRPFPLKPSAAEIAMNPRSRSAKLRVFEKN
jgi:16S rRNA (cytosine1402-N4)-methyltransferase